jgi:phosphonopyruvate decarboxylase
MITAEDFIKSAGDRGYDFYTGVPCSFLSPLINGALGSSALTYVGAASEGEAVAIAAGAWLAGRGTVVICQNSGLGNAVNPLTSLSPPFRIPTLLVTTWRGQPGLTDEPQHDIMGRITRALLDVIEIPHELFPNSTAELGPALDRACGRMDSSGLPFAFVMRRDDVEEQDLRAPPFRVLPAAGEQTRPDESGPTPSRADVLERFLALTDDRTAVVATTGKCGRELFTLSDRAQHLYQVGSMGCASGMALGIALNSPLKIVVLDGDGAALMKLGTLATIGAYAPRNLIHILLDNGVHDSTGGQPTVSASVDFAAVALACRYRSVARCSSLEAFEAAYRSAAEGDGPAMIHVRITPGSMAKLGRPTVAPAVVARRFKSFLSEAGRMPSKR